MTAFGRSRRSGEGKDITVEIRSVNNRYMDCFVKIPRTYAALEDRIKPYLQSRGISRGKIEVYVGVENTAESEVCVEADIAYTASYLAALRQLRDTFGLKDDTSLMRVAQNKDVLRVKKLEADAEADWQLILPVLDEACDAFIAARRAEGQRLESDVDAKISNIKQNTARILELSKKDIDGYRAKIEQRIRDILADNRVTVDENRLLTECAFAADRLAVDEELVRLNSHFEAFAEIIGSSEPSGRRMDFLIQEMNREINTIGSKCQNSAIAHIVVDCKAELEKIREQIQNVE